MLIELPDSRQVSVDQRFGRDLARCHRRLQLSDGGLDDVDVIPCANPRRACATRRASRKARNSGSGSAGQSAHPQETPAVDFRGNAAIGTTRLLLFAFMF